MDNDAEAVLEATAIVEATAAENAPAAPAPSAECAAVAETRVEGTTSVLGNLWQNHRADMLHAGRGLMLALLVIAVAWLANRICRSLIQATTKKIATLDNALGNILCSLVKGLIWVLAILVILDLFGVNTASILTVLGAAGLAVALALKDSLGNIAAGFMLLFQRPYKVGDYVDCGSVSGTIMEMGLFTTTLKTLDGIYVSAPNSVIFGTPIKNYSRNPTRRADITVGIAYGDSLPVALEVLKRMLATHPLVCQEPTPDVMVADLADSSVNLTLRFWAKTDDYWKAYWDVKRRLKEVIESNGLNIPFPQRVVTIVQPPGKEE